MLSHLAVFMVRGGKTILKWSVPPQSKVFWCSLCSVQVSSAAWPTWIWWVCRLFRTPHADNAWRAWYDNVCFCL